MHDAAAIPGAGAVSDARKRDFRWKFFQVTFAFVYAGVVLDVVTTRLGYIKSGSAYEQNPLGGSLIGHVGWIGLLALLTLLCLICYHSVRVVYRRMALGWSTFINTVMVLIALFRWLAVVTSVIYLLQPTAHP